MDDREMEGACDKMADNTVHGVISALNIEVIPTL